MKLLPVKPTIKFSVLAQPGKPVPDGVSVG